MEEASKYDFCPMTFVLPGDYALFVEVRCGDREGGNGAVHSLALTRHSRHRVVARHAP